MLLVSHDRALGRARRKVGGTKQNSHPASLPSALGGIHADRGPRARRRSCCWASYAIAIARAILLNMHGDKQTSIDVALNVLELLSTEKAKLGIIEMSKALAKKPSTLHRTVTILKNRGYIEQAHERGKYQLGLKVFELGSSYQEQNDVMKDALHKLEVLAQETQETINLAVLDQGMKEIIYIAKIDSSHVLRTDIRIGTKLYAHCTALGKVLLASLDPSTLERLFPRHTNLPQYTTLSIPNTDLLHEKLVEVRESGYAIDMQEFRNEVVCIAMPFRDVNKKTVAAVSVTAPAYRCSKKRIDQVRNTMFRVLEGGK